MEMLRVHLLVMASFALVLLIMGMPSIHAQSLAPAPGLLPSFLSHTHTVEIHVVTKGKYIFKGIALAIDQGIAYVLMAVALLLTYMIH